MWPCSRRTRLSVDSVISILLSVVGDGLEGGGRAGGGRGGSRFSRAARDTAATPAGREIVGYLLRHFVAFANEFWFLREFVFFQKHLHLGRREI